MSELRQSPSTGEWVVIATERAKRPHELKEQKDLAEKDLEIFSPTCPFCEGNEDLTPPEILAFRNSHSKANTPGWWVRVVPNKFAALQPLEKVERKEGRKGLLRAISGHGTAEVIIDSPQHNNHLAITSITQAEEVFLASHARFKELCQEKSYKQIVLFKNHGIRAGTSLMHPHTQIIATPVVPFAMRQKLKSAAQHYDNTGECIYCSILEEEKHIGTRIVLETEHFIAFEPFASRQPFETWIVPKKHGSSFACTKQNEVKDFGRITQVMLKKLYYGLNDPDFNFVVYSTPCHEPNEEYYHWHLQIRPRISTAAGFELGSGIFINSVLPEEAAAFLREIQV